MGKRNGIMIICAVILVLSFVGTASATNWSVDCSGEADFTGIQEAINNASDDDTIIVHSCVYYENVVVNKSITLKGNGQPVVDAGGKGDAITLIADGITLEGFTVVNSGRSQGDAGINVNSSNNNITSNNVCNNNWIGIRTRDSSNNTITGNNVSNNGGGIILFNASNNTIVGNNAINNFGSGINFCYSSNNTITENNVSNNNDGIRPTRFNNNNNIYLNNFLGNTDNVYSSRSTNIWNSPLEITYTYDGSTYESYLGNYWDDYDGTDTDGDEIGNTYYSIDSKKDERDAYPLMQPFENYIT